MPVKICLKVQAVLCFSLVSQTDQGLGSRWHCSYSVFTLGPNASSTMANTVKQVAQSTKLLLENTAIHQE